MKSNLPSLPLANKVAIVTGGTSGIGQATAVEFARAGAKVVVAGRREKEGNNVVSEIKALGGDGTFFRTDVTRESDLSALVDHTLSTFGRLDFVFNNAGLLGPAAPTTEQTVETYEAIFNTNVRSVFLAMKYQIPAILKSGGGAIINNASVGGSIGFPNVGLYVASKHAVIGLTKTAALEFAPKGVRVNTVSPGGIQTPMFDNLFGEGETAEKKWMAEQHPVGRVGKPEEIASAVVWLCSPGATFVTGHDLIVDGGFTAK